MLNISKGIVLRPQKVVVYGPEGIGKSTFASHFPDPLFPLNRFTYSLNSNTL